MKNFNLIGSAHAVDFPALEFAICLDPDGSFVVREKLGRIGAAFVELSSAILFVRNECEVRRCATIMKFDQNLAFIRAAG